MWFTLYRHKTHWANVCVYTFRPEATLRKSWNTIFCPWGGRAYLDVWPVFYLCLSYKCPPSISSCVRLKTHWFIGLAAFLDINSEKNKFDLRGSVGLCPFLQHVRCVTPSLTEFPDGLKPSALARQMNLKQAMRFLLESAFQDRTALVNLVWKRYLV